MLAIAPATAGAQQMSPSMPMMVQTTSNFTVVLEVGPPTEMVAPGTSTTDTSAEVMVGMVGMPMAATDTSMSMGNQSTSSMGMGHESSMGTSPDTSMGMGANSMTDEGMGVNHHLEVHITDNSSGATVNDVSPVIRIRDKSSGVSRDLNDIMAMYSAQMGPSDFHYGQNVWLPDGQYDITVMLGTQSALFQGVNISGGMPMTMMGG
jgi:hypothetical protein